jgi:uncharacterized membrane protein
MAWRSDWHWTRIRFARWMGQQMWLTNLLAAFAGAVVGSVLASSEASRSWLGNRTKAWVEDPSTARTNLEAVFTAQLAIFSIVLSLMVLTVQMAANQYSPRLLPMYARGPALRRTVTPFAFSTAYVLSAVHELEKRGPGEAPQPVLAGAFLLLVTTMVLLIAELFQTFHRIRIEEILRRVTAEALRAHSRLLERRRWLGVRTEGTLELAARALPLRAAKSGYLADLALARLADLARAVGVRVRTTRSIGDYVDAGEIIGWAAPDDDRTPGPRIAEKLASTILIEGTRDGALDVGLGIRALVDIADRALSAAINDPYTGRQALHDLRTVLRRLVLAPQGDWQLVDPDGRVRVVAMFPSLREQVSLATDGPSRFGAAEPDIMEALLEIARELAVARPDRDTKEIARALVRRVLDDAASKLDEARMEELRARATCALETIEVGHRPDERIFRAEWELEPLH